MKDPSVIVKNSHSLDRSRSRRYELALQIAPDYPHNTAIELYNHIQDLGYYWDGKFRLWAKSQAKQYEGMRSDEIKIRLHGSKEALLRFREEFCQFLKDQGFELQGRPLINIMPVSPLEKDIHASYAVIRLPSED